MLPVTRTRWLSLKFNITTITIIITITTGGIITTTGGIIITGTGIIITIIIIGHTPSINGFAKPLGGPQSIIAARRELHAA
jgi:hypothetical protein